MNGLFQIVCECLSFQVCLAIPSFCQVMLSLKFCELSGPKLGLGHDCRGGGVSAMSQSLVYNSVMVGEKVVISDSPVSGDTPCQCQASGRRGG